MRISLSPKSSWELGGYRVARKAVWMRAVSSGSFSGSSRSSKPLSDVKLFVGLPLDAVSVCNSVNHDKAIAVSLKALKLLGVEGVELPVWWGVAEKGAMGKYEWSGYLALAEMVRSAGLMLHVSLCFHASEQAKIPLPEWISKIGESQPAIYFTDRSGNQYKGCLSLAIDDLPVLNGKTPLQVYHEFCENFKSSFSPLMGSTISGISMGLGPDGELLYPSQQLLIKGNKFPGVGEFQCYGENMLGRLKRHSEATGNPSWGFGGPHDAPSYSELPNSSSFFKDHGGSWESSYGDFFLRWYSNELISHGDRILAMASSIFRDTAANICGKLPLLHHWYRTRAHPCELTAGFYNTAARDGYEAVAEMFARNWCKMVLPGMDLSDGHQPEETLSSPESLLAQIRSSCRKHGVNIMGLNSSESGAPGGLEQIEKNLLGEKNVVDSFIYQRMGAYFFSPEHFPSFAKFVQKIKQQELNSDDLPMEDEAAAESKLLTLASEMQMLVA